MYKLTLYQKLKTNSLKVVKDKIIELVLVVKLLFLF